MNTTTPTATWVNIATITTTTTNGVVYVTQRSSEQTTSVSWEWQVVEVAAPLRPKARQRRFDDERAPKQHRHRLEGARHGFAQAARLPCYRGARTR